MCADNRRPARPFIEEKIVPDADGPGYSAKSRQNIALPGGPAAAENRRHSQVYDFFKYIGTLSRGMCRTDSS